MGGDAQESLHLTCCFPAFRLPPLLQYTSYCAPRQLMQTVSFSLETVVAAPRLSANCSMCICNPVTSGGSVSCLLPTSKMQFFLMSTLKLPGPALLSERTHIGVQLRS